MNYEAKNLPYTLFEKIGMSKKEVLGLPKDDLVALLSGRTTSLKDLKIQTDTGEIKERAKLSIYALPDNSLAIRIHPIRSEIKNEFNLKPHQIEDLKQGKLIVENKTSQNGEREKHIFQLDREINEIKSVRVNSIKIPNQIDNIQISTKQKTELLEGKTVDLVNKNGEVKTVAVDLLKQTGYAVLNENLNTIRKNSTGDALNNKDNSYKELVSKATTVTVEHDREQTNGLKR